LLDWVACDLRFMFCPMISTEPLVPPMKLFDLPERVMIRAKHVIRVLGSAPCFWRLVLFAKRS